MTPARTDLPAVGDHIAALHGGGAWYFGPLLVLRVEHFSIGAVIEVHPIYWPDNATMVFDSTADGQCYPLEWNKFNDLTKEERGEILTNAQRIQDSWQKRKTE
jgi:hypothetical protein